MIQILREFGFFQMQISYSDEGSD